MWNLIAVLALAVTGALDVTATRLDGTSAAGQLQSWTGHDVVVATQAGPQTIDAAELLELRFSATGTDDTGAPLIELIDGSLLPLANYTTSDERAEIQLQLPSPAEPQTLVAPLEKVRSVRLQQLAAEALPQWMEIRALNLPSDVVVVSKRGGKSLDHLECVVGAITKEDVELMVDGQSMKVPRSKVAGVIYYRSNEPTPASAIVVGAEGLRIAAAEVSLQGEMLRAETESHLLLQWPLAGVASIDMSAGKVAFLGDLKPVSTKWQPLVGLPTAASRALQFGQPRFNQSATGGPLTLTFRAADPSVGSPETKTFAKGLSLRSRSEVVYRLPAGYGTLLAEVGVDPNDSASGNVHLSVFGDDQLLIEREIDGSDAPVSLDVEIAGVKRLKLVVDYGENLDTGDWLNLCNARIVK